MTQQERIMFLRSLVNDYTISISGEIRRIGLLMEKSAIAKLLTAPPDKLEETVSWFFTVANSLKESKIEASYAEALLQTFVEELTYDGGEK